MPCSGPGGPSYSELEETEKQKDKAEAMLCAVLGQVEGLRVLNSVLAGINPTESGVTAKEIRNWWEAHKKRDNERRTREAAEAEEKRKRKQALAKLTKEERKLLGVRG